MASKPPHQCTENCRRYSQYGAPLSHNELLEFQRLRIELSKQVFEEHTNSYVRSQIFNYLNQKPVSECIIFYYPQTTDKIDFQKLILLDVFGKKNLAFKKKCNYDERGHTCVNPDHYE